MYMNILGIDTSCDETTASVVKIDKDDIRIKSNIISSQVKLHEKFGGVYPTIAKREHQKNLVPTVKKALEEAEVLKKEKRNLKKKKIKSILKREKTLSKATIDFLKKYTADIDKIAITQGPGLDPCLWIGINFAKTLSFSWRKPTVPINHIEAHLLSPLLKLKSKEEFKSLLPACALVVSGGHTQLVLVKDIKKYKVLGATKDDAAGECFDKTARILGLSYPGGPKIAKKAKKEGMDFDLPRPMINSGDYNFSFSGLKTAVLYKHKEQKESTKQKEKYINGMSKEIQNSIVEVLVSKTTQAVKEFKVKSVMIGGGVAANQKLREELKKAIRENDLNIPFHAPSSRLCTDNAAMVALMGAFEQIKSYQKIKSKPNLKI